MKISEIKADSKLCYPCSTCGLRLYQGPKEPEKDFLIRAYEHVNTKPKPSIEEDPLDNGLVLFTPRGFHVKYKHIILGDREYHQGTQDQREYMHWMGHRIEEAWEINVRGVLEPYLSGSLGNVYSPDFSERLKEGFYKVLTPDEFQKFQQAYENPSPYSKKFDPAQLKRTTPELEKLLGN